MLVYAAVSIRYVMRALTVCNVFLLLPDALIQLKLMWCLRQRQQD